MSSRISLLIAACFSAACRSAVLDELQDNATRPSEPPCDGNEFVIEWRPDGYLVPSVTVEDDGFYGLAHDYQNGVFDVERYAPQGEPSVVATFPAPPATASLQRVPLYDLRWSPREAH